MLAVAVKETRTPFSAFANPFDSGKAARMPPRELVRFTFAALEAWARERDLGRREDETAMEFVQRIAEEVPALENEGQRLANLHARAEYAREGLPANTVDVVRAFWQRLERVVDASHVRAERRRLIADKSDFPLALKSSADACPHQRPDPQAQKTHLRSKMVRRQHQVDRQLSVT